MKNLIIWTLAVVSLLCGCTKDGSTKLKDVEDVCTQMDDIKFMEYCYEHFDVNKDGMVSMAEATAVRTIDVRLKGIYSLKGVEYFTQLVELECSANNLSALDVSKNTQLTDLNCSGNNLSSLDVSKNTQLTELICRWNGIASLDISALPKLERSFYRLYDWGVQNDNIIITITDKKEYWDKLPSEDYGIKWVWK